MGKDISNIDKDELLLYEELLYDLNMNFYSLKDINDPHSSIAYFDKENSFYHPFSLKEVGKEFGYHRLSELLPLKDYLEIPPSLLDDVIDGYIEGQKLRSRREEDNKSKDRRTNDKLDKKMLDQLSKELG